MDDAILQLFGRAELFSRLGAATRTAAARVAERRAFAAGEVVFHQGEPSHYVFVIERGAIAASARSEQGAEVPLRLLGIDAVGGLTSVALEKGRSATLRARVDSVLVTIARQDFLTLLAEHADLGQAILAHLGAKIRAKNRQIATLAAAARTDTRTGVAFFDTKPYDRDSFDAHAPEHLRLQYFEPAFAKFRHLPDNCKGRFFQR